MSASWNEKRAKLRNAVMERDAEITRLNAELTTKSSHVERLTAALERLACRHVTEAPLWWQVEARKALANLTPQDQQPVAPSADGAERYTESEWRVIDDLRRNWRSFCDCDAFDGSADFAERMEAAGMIALRPVKESDLEESFAAERGIERDGLLWELTYKGLKSIAQPAGADC
ncbi:MAG: hypothetical protein ACOY6K_12480 [Pseudomonadota bacterium]